MCYYSTSFSRFLGVRQTGLGSMWLIWFNKKGNYFFKLFFFPLYKKYLENWYFYFLWIFVPNINIYLIWRNESVIFKNQSGEPFSQFYNTVSLLVSSLLLSRARISPILYAFISNQRPNKMETITMFNFI